MTYRHYVLVALTAVYTLNLVDRGLMILLLEPIKNDLQLTDSQLGFLTGIAFGLFYATLGVPIARWADRGDRVTITALSIGAWGATVMASIFVQNYVELVLARVLAAVGESGCKPPTYSLVGDYFRSPAERTRAMAVYTAGGLLSNLLSFVAGGWLNEMYGWRLAFFCMGILGLVLAIVIRVSVREPRAAGIGRVSHSETPPPLTQVLLLLWRTRSLRHLSAALILLYTMGLGLSPWYAAFMMRSHGMGTGELGVWLGLIFGLGGVSGVLLGSYVACRWYATDDAGQMRMSGITVVSLVPCFMAFLGLPKRWEALISLIPLIMTLSGFLAPTYSLMQRLVRDDMRATFLAVVMLLANLLGMGVGPQIVGIVSDCLKPMAGSESLRYAMLLVSLLAFWAAYHFFKVSRYVKADLERLV